MAKSRDRDIELNPHFAVPPGVVDVRQENKENQDFIYTQHPDTIAVDGPVLQSPDATIPNAPSGYTIVSQTVRVGADGKSVTDVLLEFPDIGPYEIDVAVTPV